MLNKIAELVQTQGHCVLATCGQGEGGFAPHASLMAYCPAPDCREFWLASPRATRKMRNLAANPVASLLIDDRSGDGSDRVPGGACGSGPSSALTVSVRAMPFDSARHEALVRTAFLARHPGLSGFLADDGVVVLRLRAVSFQLLTGLSEVFFVEAEKMLDARPRRA